jgi:AraC-like DNA-binding protein
MARQTASRQQQLAATSTFGGTSSTTTQAVSIRLSDEQHDSPAQLAERWALSSDYIRRLFKDEAGVIVIYRPETLHKRAYSTMRIPRSVAHRVHCRLQSR